MLAHTTKDHIFQFFARYFSSWDICRVPFTVYPAPIISIHKASNKIHPVLHPGNPIFVAMPYPMYTNFRIRPVNYLFQVHLGNRLVFTVFINFVNSRHANNSSLGIDVFIRGATFVFDANNFRKYAPFTLNLT